MTSSRSVACIATSMILLLAAGMAAEAQELLYSGNLLQNFSIEDGGHFNVDGWSTSGHVYRHSISAFGFTGYNMVDGEHAIKMFEPDGDLSQSDIPVVGGERYTVSGWFYHSSTEDKIALSVFSTRMFLRVEWFDANGILLRDDYSANHNGRSPADWWTRISFDVFSPADADHATFHVHSDSDEGDGSVFGDAFFFGPSTSIGGPARATFYVSTNGAHIPPFTSPANAANSIEAALSMASPSSLILVDDGVYGVTSPISPPPYVTIRGLNGPATTVIDGANRSRCFQLEANGAVIDGLTITHGRARSGYGWSEWDYESGGGIIAKDGTIRNCIIRGNYADRFGGGVCLLGFAKLVNCTVIENTVGPNSYGGYSFGPGAGGGVATFGGTVENCLIVSNTASYRGGGVYCTNGVVRGSTISDNRTFSIYHRNCCYSTTEAGGVYLYSGLLENCRILRNSAKQGGGVYARATNAIVRSCVIARNRGRVGGGILGKPAAIQNCTIAYNEADHQGGGVSVDSGSTVRNTIIWFNEASEGMNVLADTNVILSHCSTYPAPSSNGNTEEDPFFSNANADDFRPVPGSSCLDAGEHAHWVFNTPDMDGHSRIRDVAPDIGAYEFSSESMVVGIAADTWSGTVPCKIRLTARIGKPHPNLYYEWDFDGDGSTDLAGAELGTVLHTYSSVGHYTPHLKVTSSFTNLAGTSPRAIHVSVPVLHVSPSGSNTFPYTDWGSAATSIQAAVDAAGAGALVLVTNGTYELTSQVTVEAGIKLRSVNGADVTILDGHGSNRCVWVNYRGAVVEGFTIARGYTESVGGAGVYCGPGSTIRDCTISSCRSGYDDYSYERYYFGGGINCAGGHIKNCLVVSNQVSGDGGGIFLQEGGTVQDCTVLANSAFATRVGFYGTRDSGGGGICAAASARIKRTTLVGNYARAGGGLYLRGTASRCLMRTNIAWSGGGAYVAEGGLLVNGLVIGNAAGSGAGVRAYRGELLNCTIANNFRSYHYGYAGGVYAHDARVRNCIVYGNTFSNSANSEIRGTNGVWEFSCSTPAVEGTGNITNDPQFADSDYRLAAGSPCIDTGTRRGAKNHDYDGNPRPLDGDGNGTPAYDMGAYEFILASNDTDGDGVSDERELQSFGTDPCDCDTDGDRFPDGHEIRAGTDAHDPDSFLALSAAVPSQSEDGFVLRWPSVRGRLYALKRSSNLTAGPGESIADKVVATPPYNTYVDSTAVGPGPFFYWVAVK